MADTEATFLVTIKALLRDDAGILTDPQLKVYLQTAIEIYQTRRAQGLIHEITGDGSTVEYALSGITSWSQGFSWIERIEYPVVDTGQPEFTSKKEYGIIRLTGGDVLRFYFTITSGSKLRVWYAAPHLVDGSGSTVYTGDYYSVSQLATAKACYALSSYYNQTSQPTISIDVTDYQEKGSDYLLRAKDLEAEFDKQIPPGRGSAIGDWDLSPSWGTEFIFQGEER